MKLKHLLALASLMIGGGNLWAQTNIITGWDGGTNTDSPSTFGWTSSANRTLNARNASSGIRMTTGYSGYKLEDNTTYSYSASSDPSSVLFWVRYNTAGESFTYTFQGLEPDHYYDFSALIGWHNNSDNPTFTVTLNDGTNTLATMSKAPSAKQTLYSVSSSFKTPSTVSNTTDIKMVFTCNKTGDCMEAISALKLVNVVKKEGLSKVISYAQQVNAVLNNSTLTSAISTAQGIYNNTSSTQYQVYDATTELRNAINTAIAATELDPEGEDVSAFIFQPGFENMTAQTGNYATANGVDYTNEGWTLTTTGGYGFGAAFEYGANGQINGATIPSADNAGSTGKALGISVGWSTSQIYQSEPVQLPAGSYRFKVYSYNAGTATGMTSKVGVFPKSGSATMSAKNSFALNTWESDELSFTLDAATEVCFQIGGAAGNNTSTNHGKVFFDNLTLTYFDPLKLAQIQLEDLITTALSEHAKPMVAVQKAALGEAIATAQSASTTTVEECNSAMTALQSAIDAAASSISLYAEIKAKVIDIQSAIINDDANAAIVALNTGYNNGDYADVAAAIAGFRAAVGSSFATTENTVYTGAIVNPNFEADGAAVQNPLGWSVTNHGRDDGTRNGAVSDMSGWYYNAYQTWWDTGIDIKQTITGLPNGAYELAATVAGWTDCTVNLTGNDEYSWVQGQGDGTGVAISVTTYVTDGNLDIKVNWGVREGGTFFKADNFTLVYKGIKPMLQKVLDEANAIDKTANVGTGAFQIPSSAVSAFSAAIETAQGVYDNASATTTDVQTAIDNLNAAIEAYKSAELNAPAADVQYRIKSTAADAAVWKDKYYRLYPNSAQAHGGYSISADATDAAYLATAWKFTAVGGTANGYMLSMIDAAGTERYICTNIKGYEDGTATQIRTTDDASKALVVKVIAASGTDGRWYLQNTEDDSYLGGQDAGLFSNSQNYDLAIEAASQASVTVSCKAGKFGTVIFPFTPDVSTGFDDITFYTIESVNDATGNVQLTEVAVPEANVPYLIKNDGTEGLSQPLTGWGTATADSYTKGLLTGVYTSANINGDNRYVLQTQDAVQAFYKVNADFNATAYKCYLTYAAPSGVKSFGFEFGGNADAIQNIEVTDMNDAKIFNLAGQRVNKAQKGIYIVNGKKVLVK